MALNEIQLIPGGRGQVSQILGTGVNVLQKSIDNAVTLGRAAADLQYRQEKDVFQEREKGRLFRERRGLEQRRRFEVDRGFNRNVLEDERDFSRGVLENDRSFGLDQQRVGLQARGVALQERGLDLRKRTFEEVTLPGYDLQRRIGEQSLKRSKDLLPLELEEQGVRIGAAQNQLLATQRDLAFSPTDALYTKQITTTTEDDSRAGAVVEIFGGSFEQPSVLGGAATQEPEATVDRGKYNGMELNTVSLDGLSISALQNWAQTEGKRIFQAFPDEFNEYMKERITKEQAEREARFNNRKAGNLLNTPISGGAVSLGDIAGVEESAPAGGGPVIIVKPTGSSSF